MKVRKNFAFARRITSFIWRMRFDWLLHLTNFTLPLPNDNDVRYEQERRNVSDGFSPLVLFVIWLILYWIYKKFLNLMLRRMQFTIVRRLRLIKGLWSFGFATCNIIFLTQFAQHSPNCPWRRNNDYNLGFSIQKTFYLHRAAIQVFYQDCWLEGWSSQLLATSIPTRAFHKSRDPIIALLLYEASETALLNLCRLLVTLSRGQIVRRIAKFVFFLYFINWIFVHILLAPRVLLLYKDVEYSSRTPSSLWLWLICELINSIRYKTFGCFYTKESLEISLFLHPNEEALEFVNILKKHRYRIENSGLDNESVSNKKTELWQTISCAITMKKKLKKLRERKGKGSETSAEFNGPGND